MEVAATSSFNPRTRMSTNNTYIRSLGDFLIHHNGIVIIVLGCKRAPMYIHQPLGQPREPLHISNTNHSQA